MVQSAEDRPSSKLAEALDRPMMRRILPQGQVRSQLIVIDGIGGKDPAQVGLAEDERRRLISLSVTTNPTAEWIAPQITEAFPCDQAPDYLIRDRDASYGQAVTKRLVAMGIRDHPIRSPLDAVRAAIIAERRAMSGAGYVLARQFRSPMFAAQYLWPTRSDMCPGPARENLATLSPRVIVFVLAMIAGMSVQA
jgi:hypothetical protein